MKSKFLSLNIKDFLKGIIVAIFTGIGTYFTMNNTEINVKEVGKACIIAFCAYMAKNLFTNSADQILKPEENVIPK
jgi:hypothetical protein